MTDHLVSKFFGNDKGRSGVHDGQHIDSYDWACTTSAGVERNVLGAVDGGVSGKVLMHSNYQVTVDALPRIVRVLKERGYVFVTVEKLVADKYGASSRDLHNNYIEHCAPMLHCKR